MKSVPTQTMSDLGEKAKTATSDLEAENIELLRDVKDKVTDVYEMASDWAKENSTILFAVGGGIVLVGLITAFAMRRGKSVDAISSRDNAA